MIRLTRSIIAVTLFLISAYTLVSAIWDLGSGLISQNLEAAITGFALLGATAILLALSSVINPKPVPKKPEPAPMPHIKVLTIPANPSAPLTSDTIDAGLKALQAAVGGYIEPVGDGPDWTAWADEDGKVKRRPFNPRATHAMGFMSGHNLNDPIVGDVVLTGHTVDGEPMDLTDKVAHMAQDLAKEPTL